MSIPQNYEDILEMRTEAFSIESVLSPCTGTHFDLGVPYLDLAQRGGKKLTQSKALSTCKSTLVYLNWGANPCADNLGPKFCIHTWLTSCKLNCSIDFSLGAVCVQR